MLFSPAQASICERKGKARARHRRVVADLSLLDEHEKPMRQSEYNSL
jgi:hypothetical protein